MKKALLVSSLVFLTLFATSVLAQDPVAYWKFDECSGSTAYDSVGVNDGSLYNFTDGWVTGKYGCALDFDGIDDYVNFGNDTSLNFGTSSFSISLWMKLTNATKSMDVLSKYSISTFYGYFVSITTIPSIDGFTLGTLDGDVDCSSPDEIFADVWYHVVYVVDQDSITGKLYIDNILNTTASDTIEIGDVNNIDNLTMGISTYTPTYFNGTLDEVMLFSYALSEEEIQNLYRFNSLEAPELIAEWKFDEPTGSTAYDSENDHDCTIFGSTNRVTGKYGNALDFDGSTSYLNCGDSPAFNFGTDSYSIEFWLKTTQVTGEGDILEKTVNWNDKMFAIFHDGNMWSYMYNGTNDDWAETTAVVNDDVWHHIVAGRNYTHLLVYVDGELNASKLLEVPDNWIVDNAGNLSIGADITMLPTIRTPYEELLDNVRIWNKILSDQEVENLYLYDSLTISCGDGFCQEDQGETKANCCIDCCGAVGQTLSDIGSGIGSLFTGMGAPLVIFILLLAVGSAVGLVLAIIGRRVGAKV